MSGARFRCFQVTKSGEKLEQALKTLSLDELPPGDVVIRVHWSSLNYKDALAATAHPGVAGNLPHVPGIDAAGTVESSADPRYQPGDKVLVTGYELGAPLWGGWSEFIRVPADWVVPVPAALGLRESMVLGTAGFTAAQCVRELEISGVVPASGPIAVTGATGGVGTWAVKLLSTLGYTVHAVSGKVSKIDQLKSLGAHEVLGRDVLEDNPKRPLLSAKWGGGVDTVGGKMLVALLKSMKVTGCVAACGLVAGHQLDMTVYPFILRGVKLAGVTSSLCPRGVREEIWDRLAGPWKRELPEEWIEEISMNELSSAVERILRGEITGRVVVRISAEAGH